MSTFDFNDSCPRKDREIAHNIASALPRRPLITTGRILSIESTDMGSSWCFSCMLADGTGEVRLLFMGRRAVAGLEPGTICTIEGTAGKDGDTLIVWNPLYRLEAAE